MGQLVTRSSVPLRHGKKVVIDPLIQTHKQLKRTLIWKACGIFRVAPPPPHVLVEQRILYLSSCGLDVLNAYTVAPPSPPPHVLVEQRILYLSSCGLDVLNAYTRLIKVTPCAKLSRVLSCGISVFLMLCCSDNDGKLALLQHHVTYWIRLMD